MDPTSFTQTSFCNVQIDNITNNETKEYILNQLSILCSDIKYNSRYAKVYNDKFSNNLNNPHIICLKSSGAPYLLFATQINNTNYCFLIDKKIKEGYDYPKIFIIPYHLHPDIFLGSLFECELIRDINQQWSLSIGDTYSFKGKQMNKIIIIERINRLHSMLETEFYDSEFMKICPLQIKKYFDYKDMQDCMTNFIPHLPYVIRGFYFIPLKTTYSNILYLLKDTSNKNHKSPINKINKNEMKDKGKKSEKKDKGEKSEQNEGETFRIMKTLKPDVYELYSKDGDNLIKHGIALVQNIKISHFLISLFEHKNQCDEVFVKCKMNSHFNKWEPINDTD